MPSLGDITRDAVEAFNSFDAERISTFLDDGYENWLLPKSLGGGVRKRQDWLDWFIKYKSKTTVPLLKVCVCEVRDMTLVLT